MAVAVPHPRVVACLLQQLAKLNELIEVLVFEEQCPKQTGGINDHWSDIQEKSCSDRKEEK